MRLLLLLSFVLFGAALADEAAKYELKNDKDETVAQVQTHASFRITYKYHEDKSTEKKTTTDHIPVADASKADVTGNETESEITMHITWTAKPTKDDPNPESATWTLVFEKKPSADGELVEVTKSTLEVPVTNAYSFSLHAEDYNDTYTVDLDVSTIANMSLGSLGTESYKCSHNETYKGTVNGTGEPAEMQLTRTQMQAFMGGSAFSKDYAVCADDRKLPKESTEVSYNVTEDGVTCVMLTGKLSLKIKYDLHDGNQSDWITVPFPGDDPTGVNIATSSCGDNDTMKQEMVLDFFDDHWKLTFKFSEKEPYAEKDKFNLYQVILAADLSFMPQVFKDAVNEIQTFKNDVKSNGTGSLHKVMDAGSSNSYKCNSEETKTIADNFQLVLSSIQVQAGYKNQTEFLDASICEADQKASDIVPIIVGACLAALVVVVLIAYLIGRARAKRHGYSSV